MYLITIKTIENNILTFKVSKYEIENNMISFIDRAGFEKHFPTERCQIEEIDEKRKESDY